ncbi:hypothetical protein ABT215_23040 [Streptomyces sp900105755]|uniref:hypothetical protein n=1 Tax=Streptomyces sp. 900105755 TaxID=3154389 RepID=UPI0033306554
MSHAGRRVNALLDLPKWSDDDRAYKAVTGSLEDEETREATEYEMGMSLSRFRVKAGEIDAVVYQRLSPQVRSVVEQAVFPDLGPERCLQSADQ